VVWLGVVLLGEIYEYQLVTTLGRHNPTFPPKMDIESMALSPLNDVDQHSIGPVSALPQ
jgi:hypothetical protein